MNNTQVKQDRNTYFWGLEISRIYSSGFAEKGFYFFGALNFC